MGAYATLWGAYIELGDQTLAKTHAYKADSVRALTSKEGRFAPNFPRYFRDLQEIYSNNASAAKKKSSDYVSLYNEQMKAAIDELLQ